MVGVSQAARDHDDYRAPNYQLEDKVMGLPDAQKKLCASACGHDIVCTSNAIPMHFKRQDNQKLPIVICGVNAAL